MATPLDTQGILNAVYDSTNNALRISSTNDAVLFTTGQIQSAAAVITTNDVPRFQFPDAATTSAWVTFVAPSTWTAADIGMIWAGSAAGVNPVRWRIAVKKLDFFIDPMSEAFAADVTANLATPASAGVTNITPNHIDNFDVVSGGFGTFYSVLIQRIGADAGDTYVGTAELIGIHIARS